MRIGTWTVELWRIDWDVYERGVRAASVPRIRFALVLELVVCLKRHMFCMVRTDNNDNDDDNNYKGCGNGI